MKHIKAVEGMIKRRMENTGESRDEAIKHLIAFLKRISK